MVHCPFEMLQSDWNAIFLHAARTKLGIGLQPDLPFRVSRAEVGPRPTISGGLASNPRLKYSAPIGQCVADEEALRYDVILE